MKVKRNTLLLLACLVWSAAGFNILRIGLIAYAAYFTVLNCILSVLVFVVFQRFIFGKLVIKHTARISGYSEERQFFLKFFDGKAFAIMAVMMTGGIGLRTSGPIPGAESVLLADVSVNQQPDFFGQFHLCKPAGVFI